LLDVEDILINPLIAVRDIHFVSSVIAAGIVFFDIFVASPTLRTADLRRGTAAAIFRSHAATILWIGLVLSVVSGFAWLCLLSARIAGKPIGEVIADGTVWTVLSRTQFGFAWELRFLFAVMLAVSLWLRSARNASPSIWQRFPAALLAGAFLGSLAFAGHGQEGLGFERNIHLAADFLHLIAAGLWLGGLIPLALLLVYLRRFGEPTWTSPACDAASRFSNLGILAVGVLLISGAINASFLIDGLHSLIDTRYGQLLLLKITLFAAMVCLAGFNRQYLLPRLCDKAAIDPSTRPLQWLIRSALVETALGLGVIIIVGMLGVMAPATGVVTHLH
jgi:putative copper resistance protein D